MKTKLLILAVMILTEFCAYGQSNNKNISIDSTKIEIIGNSIYRVHKEYFNKYGSSWIGADSSNVSLSKLNLANVLFKKSKPEMLPKSINDLNNLTTILKDNPKTQLQINGYADKIGNGKSNLELSIVRARMIKLYLMEKGVEPNRILTTGFGDNHVICQSPCDKNQRVEFVLSAN